MRLFASPMYQEADPVDVAVTINADGTLTYNEVANSDDD